jgi:hypothetical protein
LGLSAALNAAVQQIPVGWLRCSDENPANKQCFYRALETLPSSVRGRSPPRRISGSISSDPKRAGISPAVTLGQLREQMSSNTRIRLDSEPVQSDSRATYMVASASTALRAGQALGASVLIVDPPRKGLEDFVLTELCKARNPSQPYAETSVFLAMDDADVNWTNDVQTLVYVSCGFEALSRDCERLLNSAGAKWRLESATGYLLFPGSDHVETLCVFRRP